MPDSFFISGANGFIGRHLCMLLRESGNEVNVLVRSDDAHLLSLGVKLWLGDLSTTSAWSECLRGVSYIIHCAGDAQYGNGAQYRIANVQLTSKLIEGAKKYAFGLKRLIFISTVGAVDRKMSDSCTMPLTELTDTYPSSDYGRSKLEAENLVRQAGIPFTIIRPTMVIGAEMRYNSHFAVFIRWALTNSWRARLAWPGRLSAIAVDDLCKAIELCATHPSAINETYFCGGESILLADCFKHARPERGLIPLKSIQALISTFPWLVPFNVKIMFLPALVASDSKLRRLGWSPLQSVEFVLKGIVQREKCRLNPDMDPGGQTVITGAASGLGRAITERLIMTRKHLLLVDCDKERLEQITKVHSNCRHLIVDLSSEEAVKKMIRSDAWRAHTITELYAIAGIGRRGPILGLSLDDQLNTIKINFSARFILTYSVTQEMRYKHFGRVLLISSSSAFQPLPFMSVYAASNAALLSLGESWAAELSDSGVQMMVACPGGMQTSFQQQGGVKVLTNEKLMSPSVVSDQIFRGFVRGKTTLLISFRCHAMSLLARIVPRKIIVSLWKSLMTKYR
jgi:short-subunit dehydrogenase/uncharacterized protein YbjT (DUF2867 family)